MVTAVARRSKKTRPVTGKQQAYQKLVILRRGRTVDRPTLCLMSGLSHPTIGELVAEGMPYIEVGRRQLFSTTHVIDWLINEKLVSRAKSRKSSSNSQSEQPGKPEPQKPRMIIPPHLANLGKKSLGTLDEPEGEDGHVGDGESSVNTS